MTPPSPVPPSLLTGDGPDAGRLHGLDWLRVLAFGLLILYHTGMVFVTWDFHVKNG